MQRYITYLLFILTFSSCKIVDRSEMVGNIDFKQEMRNFVVGISQYGKSYNPDFVIIPQNGSSLILQNGEPYGEPVQEYIHAIDAQAQEGLNYGYIRMDAATSFSDKSQIKPFLDSIKNYQKTVLITDYCISHSNINESFAKNSADGYIGFVATHRSLNNIPNYPVYQENNQAVTRLSQAKNFLYILNFEQFSSKNELINQLCQTNYDLLIIDAFFNDGTAFTRQEIQRLKHKQNGAPRMVVAYMSIGEAENYRYYWQASWDTHIPAWMEEENPNWQGNFKVKYWMKDWQNVIYGNDQSYTKIIIDHGFDGVYLDIIDAYEYFENKF